MNKKGFTLTELLVVMVILSIITAISIPLIRNIRQSNVQKEYQNYANSIKYGAKLYVDSYSEDLFGHNESGCAIISYKDLKDKNLVKDFNKDNITCETEDTFVRVVKMGDKYGYAAAIGCGKINSKGNVDISYRYPKNGIGNIDTCGIDSTAIMSFRTDITDPTALKYKTRSMKVIVSSNTGIISDPIIQYAFSDTKEGSSVSSWGILRIEPPTPGPQTEKILEGETIEVFSQQIETPKDLTGYYYLILRVDRLQDLHYNNWAQEGTDPYVYLGPFTLDNTKPEFNDSTVISSTDGYNALKPKLALKVTDVLSASNQAKAKEHLKMCTSFETDTCGKTKTAFVGYEAYDPDKVLDKIKDSLDGSMNKVFVTVVDPAGNYQTKEFDYELASVITYNGNGNTGGSTAKTYCNNRVDCPLRENGFTRTGYTFGGWYDQKTGGTKYGATVKLTKNITVYAQWNVITYNIKYNLDGGSATNNATYTIETPTFTLNNPTKKGYTFTGWTGSNGTTKQKTVKVEKGSTGDKEFTANYSINTYTLTYNMNGHGTCNPTTVSKEFNQKWGTLCSPSETGYAFNGWKSGNTVITEDSVVEDDITVTAQWQQLIYTVTLDNRSATSAGTTKIYEYYTKGWYSDANATTSISKITVPSRTGYIFGGYFTSTNGGGTKVIETNGKILASNSSLTANTTYYAYWIQMITKTFTSINCSAYTIPQTGTYRIELWGAQGGGQTGCYYIQHNNDDCKNNIVLSGGYGGYTKGDIRLNKDEVLYVCVGGRGVYKYDYPDYLLNGGFNGGGKGHSRLEPTIGPGGGATDVRYQYNTLEARIMVAGGGGGAAGNGSPTQIRGGVGGNLTGGEGYYGHIDSGCCGPGGGGTQTSGGYCPYQNDVPECKGGFGYGGNGGAAGPGGGGGYYGGAQGSWYNGAGGGSSFISGYPGCNAIISASNRNPSGQPNHYSGKVFTNMQMIAGQNPGNGKAVITLIGG